MVEGCRQPVGRGTARYAGGRRVPARRGPKVISGFRFALTERYVPRYLLSKITARRKKKLPVTHLASGFEMSEDRMFSRIEFDNMRRALRWSPTIDGACNDSGDNAQVKENFCCPGRSFLVTSLAGQKVYCNPPWSMAAQFLCHYFQEKVKDPYNTSAVFVLPAWRGADFTRYTKGMMLVKQYAKGTPGLFWAKKAGSDERAPMPGIPWAVNVWYDPPKTRPGPVHKLAVAAHAQVPRESSGVDLPVSQQGAVIPGLSMQCKGGFAGHRCSVAFDSQASNQFISERLVKELNLKCEPVDGLEVGGFDGRTQAVAGKVKGRLKLAGLHETLELLVVPLDDGYDIILGDPWFVHHRAVLNWDSGKVEARVGTKCFSIPVQMSSSTPLPEVMQGEESVGDAVAAGIPRRDVLSVGQVKTLASRGTRMFLVRINVTETPDGPQVAIQDAAVRESPPDWYPEQPDGGEILSGDGPVPQGQIAALQEEFKDVLRDLPEGLPPDRPVAHTVPLVEGAQPVWKHCFRMSPSERQAVSEYVAKLVKNGWVVPSSSPWGAPILMVPKPDGTMRVCVDYRALNALTVKNRFSLPRVDDLLDSLSGATVFTALDLASGYWQIKLKPEDCAKTAFNTHEGHYEWKVLPMGLSNAPATFQHTMNSIFAEHGLNKYVAVYLDDILIYSKTPEEHVQHLRTVLEVLRKHKFYCKPSKCQFNRSELKYLGHIVGAGGIKPDPGKVSKVKEWPVPRTVGEVRSFLGLATYFRRFIQGFSSLARPLHALTKLEVVQSHTWPWTAQCHAAFEGLKEALCSAPVLKLPDPGRPYEIVCDASVHGTGAVLLQDGHPIAYDSKKFTSAEYNYDTGEQEMLAVVRALQAFRCYVGDSPFTLVTDHEPLSFLKSAPKVSRKHARWIAFLETFDFKFEHRPGRINVADPLSRLPGSLARRHVLNAITRRRSTAVARVEDDPVLVRIREALASDAWFSDANVSKYKLTRERDLWWRGEAVVVPDADGLRAEILHSVHDSPMGGHFGVKKTRELLRRLYWWEGIDTDVDKYVRECHSCQRNKSPNHPPHGDLHPLPVPEDLWESISIDFIVKLPTTKAGHDSILTVVDRLSKYAIFIPCKEAGLKSEGLVKLLEERVIAEKGYPKHIISDIDGRVRGSAFKDWCKKHKIQDRQTTAYHSRGNGQAERFNLTVENYLRAYIDSSQDNWDELLPTAQLAINNAHQESIQTTPFHLNYGRHPWLPGITFKKVNLSGEDARDARLQQRKEWPAERRQAVALARQCLVKAAERMKRQFDKRRKPKEFEVGQRVWLSTRNLKFKGNLSSKFLPRFIGPYPIAERVGNVSYRLTLTDGMQVHPVFHVELLKEYKGEDFTPPPPIVCEDGTLKYNIEKIVEARGKGRNRQYLIHWEGFDRDADTWEPASWLREDVPQMVQEFEEQLKEKPLTRAPKRRRKR